jgi:hypothetical protein
MEIPPSSWLHKTSLSLFYFYGIQAANRLRKLPGLKQRPAARWHFKRGEHNSRFNKKK